jgi:hypothetical protein
MTLRSYLILVCMFISISIIANSGRFISQQEKKVIKREVKRLLRIKRRRRLTPIQKQELKELRGRLTAPIGEHQSELPGGSIPRYIDIS